MATRCLAPRKSKADMTNTKSTFKTLLVLAMCLCGINSEQAHAQGFVGAAVRTQPKMVKIYGAGGLQGLEAYQSGILVSETGHILTVWSYVLDTDLIAAVLNDGRKFTAELIGADPRLEIAILKIEAEGLDYFDVDESVDLSPGARILTVSNLFNVATGNEPSSVLHGIVSSKTSLNARRGAFKTPYKGPVYILDAIANNPGAAGGALTDHRGRLAGLLGKELKNDQTNTWLNYAVPMSELSTAIDDLIAGRSRPRSQSDDATKPEQPHTLNRMGIVLVPDVLNKTPPFIDFVRPGSSAAKAGIKPDDLILFVNDGMTDSCRTVNNELELIDRIDSLRMLIQRGQELVELEISGEQGTN